MSHLNFDRRVSLSQLEAAFIKPRYHSPTVRIKANLAKLTGGLANLLFSWLDFFFLFYNYHVKRKRMAVS